MVASKTKPFFLDGTVFLLGGYFHLYNLKIRLLITIFWMAL